MLPANSLTLSQCQHDALVLFTFDVGDSWMSGSGVVKSAIVSKASTNDLLKAMSDWAGNQDDFRRRKIEVNMYKNGVYSDVTPSSFGTVTYNPDGGVIAPNYATSYTLLFDTSKTSKHIPAPTRNGYKFMGWYSAQYDGTMVPSLTGSYNGKTLWAGWQATSVTANNANDRSYVHGINETLKVSQLVSLDVYPVPTKKNVKPFRTIKKDTATVTAIKDFIDDDGNRWCKLSAAGDGWVLLKSSGQSDSGNSDYTGGKINVTVTVTNSYVNRRASDSASSAKNGVYTAGTKLKIIATNEAKTWGQVEENGVAVGWVALMYTDWSTVYDGSNPSDANNTTPIATATVTYNGYLNARSDPGVDNKIVGGFAKDTTVNVFEIRTVNGHRWGRTSSGWICLTYTSVKMLTDKNVSDQGVLDYAFEVTMVNSGADLKTYAEPSTNSIDSDTIKAGTTGVKMLTDKNVSDTGVLDYAFEVTLVNAGADLSTYVQPTTSSNNSDTIKAGTTGLKITNAAVADGVIWVKAHWTVKETDKNGKTNVIAKSGWVTYNNFNLVPTKFTVVSDTLNIRDAAGSQNQFVFKLTKGVEVEVHEISLANEEIWGRIEGYTSGGVNYDGWINLASNYVKRSSKITIDGGTKGAIGTGTVVNADSVRVRMTGALYGQVLGSINRGTKVAVLEEKDGWYKIDFDVDNNKETDSWIYSQYLEVKMGVVESGTGSTGSTGGTGTTQKTDGTGKGIIANTYAGVNVRSGAGIANAIVGKILNGTEVTILEVKLVGAAKWGRVKQGWICMDYVTMISYDEIPGNNSNNGSSGNKGTGVDSFDEAERTTTTAVYTGSVKADTTVYKTPNPNLKDNTVRSIGTGENITIHELTAVTLEIYEGDKVDDKNKNNDVETVVKQTSYWARINDGWIKDPDVNIQLNALDEKVHTVTGASELNVREDCRNQQYEPCQAEEGRSGSRDQAGDRQGFRHQNPHRLGSCGNQRRHRGLLRPELHVRGCSVREEGRAYDSDNSLRAHHRQHRQHRRRRLREQQGRLQVHRQGHQHRVSECPRYRLYRRQEGYHIEEGRQPGDLRDQDLRGYGMGSLRRRLGLPVLR